MFYTATSRGAAQSGPATQGLCLDAPRRQQALVPPPYLEARPRRGRCGHPPPYLEAASRQAVRL